MTPGEVQRCWRGAALFRAGTTHDSESWHSAEEVGSGLVHSGVFPENDLKTSKEVQKRREVSGMQCSSPPDRMAHIGIAASRKPLYATSGLLLAVLVFSSVGQYRYRTSVRWAL